MNVEIGQPAPPFRLPTGKGTEVGLEDYRGEKNVVVWFTKGMACPFCRQHMSRLVRGYPRFRELGGEILEVAPTPPARAKVYAEKFPLPFPYLCDPDYRVFGAWGLHARSHGPVWYARQFFGNAQMKCEGTEEFGPPKPDFSQIHRLLVDDDSGLFIVDRDGVVRYASTGTYMDAAGARQIPSNEEIERELAKLGGPG